MKKFNKNNKNRSDRRDSGGSDREDSYRSDRRGSSRRDSRGSDRRGSYGSDRRGSNRRDFGRSSRRSEPLTMHPAVCDECKKDCEVPFKPTSSKPIYCKDCFDKKERSGSKNNSGEYEKEFVQVNQKLDKILKALELNAKT